MKDHAGNALVPGAPVTVWRTSDRPRYHQGSHGTVESLGRTRVKVRIERAAFEHNDGEVVAFRPEDLECGHNGTPRTWERMANAVTDVQRDVVSEALQLGLDRGILTSTQKQELELMWEAHIEAAPGPMGLSAT